MKNALYLGLGIFALVFVSCNNAGSSSQKEESASPSKPVAIEPVLFFKAGGNEPGWHMQMTAANDGTFPVTLVLDYGADTLHGVVKKAPIMEPTSDGAGKPTVGTNESKFAGSASEGDGGQAFDIVILSGSCSDDADKKYGASVVVNLQDQSLRGCGDYYE